MMEYKVGDRVRLSDRGKAEFSDHESNPYNIGGTITGEGLFLAHKVEWDNGHYNTYDPEHLEIVDQVSPVAANLNIDITPATAAMNDFADACERAVAALEKLNALLNK